MFDITTFVGCVVLCSDLLLLLLYFRDRRDVYNHIDHVRLIILLAEDDGDNDKSQ